MLAILIYIVSASAFPLLLAGGSRICPPGTYTPEPEGDCTPCSECPEPKIVRETCRDNIDTVCGTFTEFLHFKNSNTLKVVPTVEKPRTNTKLDTTPEVANNSNDEWHTITMVTIGVLSVSAALFSAFIIVICLKYRRQFKEGLITEIERDSDFDKADPEMRYPLPGPSGSNTATSSIDTSFRSIEQFEIAEESPPE